MGNSFVGGKKKTTKVMKISGETFKLKTPVTAEELLKDYPGHVLLDSESVKHFGRRARPLQGHQHLEPRRLYFLVELPQAPKESVPRRVRSGIQMSAKDRLESLMLARRSASDLTIMKPVTGMKTEEGGGGGDDGQVRIKVRLPKAEVERLLKESESEAEAAEKIVDLCLLDKKQRHWHQNDVGNIADGSIRASEGFKTAKKRVSFLPMNEVSQIAVAS